MEILCDGIKDLFSLSSLSLNFSNNCIGEREEEMKSLASALKNLRLLNKLELNLKENKLD